MMIITCGQCQARFKVAPEQIKVTGSKVRCSNCGYVFTVYRPGEAEGGEGPPRESPQARRERRRRLYADEAELGGPREDEDGGWDEAGLDEAAGRPPLRRRPAPPPEEPKPSPWDGTEPGPAGDPGYDPGDDLDDDLDDDPYEGRAEGRADDPVYDDDPEDDPADDSRRAAAAPPPADDPPPSPPSADPHPGLGGGPARPLCEN
ncbi:MAG: zinc-ribbon domain-containing protein, partial [Deltaproteobacteria bacterium]|nr:zinc-ribbon domain-containing protein [Deltaproteobacteria bacterium]